MRRFYIGVHTYSIWTLSSCDECTLKWYLHALQRYAFTSFFTMVKKGSVCEYHFPFRLSSTMSVANLVKSVPILICSRRKLFLFCANTFVCSTSAYLPKGAGLAIFSLSRAVGIISNRFRKYARLALCGRRHGRSIFWSCNDL